MMRAIVLVLFFSFGCISGQFDEEIEEVPSTHMPHLLTSESKVEATMGETATFLCEVDDLGDYVLIWKKGRNQMLFAGQMKITKDDRINIAGSSLVISNVHPKDSGEYTCQISTIPPLELSHKLDVLYPPTIKRDPKEDFLTVKEGETVSLSCTATGNPKPSITWKHAGRHYDDSDDVNYRINNAQKSDSGEYECIADNGVGDPDTAVITVEVVSAPKVYPNPRSGLLVVNEGETISISCEATGDPAPVISWKRPGGEKALKVREENKIVITEATRSHSGNYECIANNSLGIFTSAIIRVQVLYAPEIRTPHSWIHAGEGTNVNISCIIRGEPVPSVTWKNGAGQAIYTNDHYYTKTDGHLHVLEIRHLKEDDFGRYDCLASNSLGSETESIHIIGTPQTPVITSKPHGSQGTKYTISWTVEAQTPVAEYNLRFRKKDSGSNWVSKAVEPSHREGSIHTEMFQFTNLEPATSYEAQVAARNKFGWSKESDIIVFTTKKEDKHLESALSSSSSTLVNFMIIFPMIFISVYHSLL